MLGDRCTSVMAKSGILVETLCFYIKAPYEEQLLHHLEQTDLKICFIFRKIKMFWLFLMVMIHYLFIDNFIGSVIYKSD